MLLWHDIRQFPMGVRHRVGMGALGLDKPLLARAALGEARRDMCGAKAGIVKARVRGEGRKARCGVCAARNGVGLTARRTSLARAQARGRPGR